MNRTTRLWIFTVPAALVAGVLAVWLTVTSDHQQLPRLAATVGLLGGWSFIFAGLIARTRQPHNRTGLLMIAVGLSSFVGSLFASNNDVLWTIGLAMAAVSGGFFVHLLLAYPSGRLETTWDRGLVVTGYVLVTVVDLPFLIIDSHPVENCADCPTSVLLVSNNETAATIFTVLVETIAVLFLLAVVATLVDRLRRASSAARRVLTPVLLSGAATLVLFAVHVGTQDLWPDVANVAGWAAMFALVGVPFLFLWGLLESRLARADISRALAEEPGERAPRETQERIRRLLRDPTAEFLFWCGGEVRAYSDVEGRRRDLDDVPPGRIVTRIDRGDSPIGAIVHDPMLLEEPELLEQVAAAMGLELERDRTIFELHATERRNRALVEAMPDNMFRIAADGTFLDIQESPGPNQARIQAEVGSSVYDYPVPRELIDRVMFAGKLALSTGQLQTIEWTLGKAGDLRHQEGRFVPSGKGEFFLVVRDVTARKRQEAEQAALHRVALAVASEGRSEQIFSLVAEQMGRVLEADSAILLRYDMEEGEALVVGSWKEPGAVAHPVGRRAPIAGTASGTVYATAQPVRFGADGEDVPDNLAAQMSEMGIGSVVAAPITVTGSPWGAVVATLVEPHSFPPGAENRLGAFTQLVSLALANEEARGELASSRTRLMAAGDEERRRLERNLHDGAQQRLVSLSLSLRLAQGKLESNPGAADELLQAARVELNVALEELRELARGIHPAILTERGLGPALESLIDRAPLPVELDLPAADRLPRPVEAAAYYVVSEALANVAKYAHASGVTVAVSREDRLAIVEVVDDGVGGADPRLGSGLRGLTDRIEALDGVLFVSSPPARGTTIRAEIPCELDEDADGEVATPAHAGLHDFR